MSDEGHLLVMRSVTNTARSLDIMVDLGLSLLALDAAALRFRQVPRLAKLERELESLEQARRRIDLA